MQAIQSQRNRRDATDAELKAAEALPSRSGFRDGFAVACEAACSAFIASLRFTSALNQKDAVKSDRAPERQERLCHVWPELLHGLVKRNGARDRPASWSPGADDLGV
jgi:hypothetical protein